MKKFCLFKFDVDESTAVYATNVFPDPPTQAHTKIEVPFQGKRLWGTVLALAGKILICKICMFFEREGDAFFVVRNLFILPFWVKVRSNVVFPRLSPSIKSLADSRIRACQTSRVECLFK